MVKQIANMSDFDNELQSTEALVVVDFFATWCGPCVHISPKFAEMSNKYTNAVFLKVDVDEADDVAEYCGISAMPTFQFFKGGQKVDELVGASEEQLKQKIEANL